jgi:glucan 1,3-beta-glucosidase
VTGQFPYLLRAVQWARELSLGVMVDLHGLPGSQNGDDHSGRVGTPLYATNGTNLDRALGVLRNLTEEFTRAEYGGAVQAIEVMNEPRLFSNGDASFTMPYLKDTYAQASVVIRSVAAAAGMTVTIHDAFWGSNYWRGYDPSGDDNNGSGRGQSPDWLQLDVHEYYAFAPRQNLPRDQIIGQWPDSPLTAIRRYKLTARHPADSICNTSRLLKSTSSGRPGTVVGEWSLETGASADLVMRSHCNRKPDC